MSTLSIAEQTLRWIARALSILSTVVLLLFVFGEPFPVSQINTAEWLGLMLFPGGVVVGFAVGWWKERLGASITIGSLIAFYLAFVFLLNGNLYSGGWFLVFASPGFLFLISSLMTRQQRAAA